MAKKNTTDNSQFTGNPLELAWAAKKAQAAARAEMEPRDRAKEAFRDLINDAGARITSGGRRTLLGFVQNGQYMDATGNEGLTVDEVRKGLDYLQGELARVYEILDGTREVVKKGFDL